MKITTLVNETGNVIAALLPRAESQYGDEPAGFVGITPATGETLREVDIPDDQVPAEPGLEFLETLQRAVAQRAGQSSC
jgi:hypothetical protein